MSNNCWCCGEYADWNTSYGPQSALLCARCVDKQAERISRLTHLNVHQAHTAVATAWLNLALQRDMRITEKAD